MQEQAVKLSEVVSIFKLDTRQVTQSQPTLTRQRPANVAPVSPLIAKTPARIEPRTAGTDEASSWEQF